MGGGSAEQPLPPPPNTHAHPPSLPAAALGGSLTFGRGASEIGRTDWVALTWEWLRGAFPASALTLVNGAVAASPSEYMALCMHQHLPPNPDLVIVSGGRREGGKGKQTWVRGELLVVHACATRPRPLAACDPPPPSHTHMHPPPHTQLEYNINDGALPWEHAHRRSYERLVRRLLELPSRPLVVPVMMFNYHRYQVGGWVKGGGGGIGWGVSVGVGEWAGGGLAAAAASADAAAATGVCGCRPRIPAHAPARLGVLPPCCSTTAPLS